MLPAHSLGGLGCGILSYLLVISLICATMSEACGIYAMYGHPVIRSILSGFRLYRLQFRD